MENEYMLINNDEVEKRIRYERELATAFVGMKRRYKTWDNFRKLNLIDTKAIAKAFGFVYFDYRIWDNFKWLLENTNLKNNPKVIAEVFGNIIYQKWENLIWLLENTSLNNDPRSIAGVFSAISSKYLFDNGGRCFFDSDRTWENLKWLFDNTNLKNDPMAIANAFSALKENDRSWENLKWLFDNTDIKNDLKAIARAFSALWSSNPTWDNLNFLLDNTNLKNDPIAIAEVFRALRKNDRTWGNFKWLFENTNLANEPMAIATAFRVLNTSWTNFKDLLVKLEGNPKAIAKAFAGLQNNDRTQINLQWLLENTNLANEPMAIATAFTYLSYLYKNLTTFNFMCEKVNGNSAAIKKMHDSLSSIDREWEFITDTDSTCLPEKQIIPNPITHKCKKTWKDLKRDFGQKSPARIGGGVILGILAVPALVLLFLHIFCPPAAVIIDGALATVGIGGGSAAIVVPVTAGGIGLGSGVLSGILFHKRFIFPEVSNDVKKQIQQRNQSSLLAGNTGNSQANERDQLQQRSNENDKPSVLNDLVPNAILESKTGIGNEQIQNENDMDLDN